MKIYELVELLTNQEFEDDAEILVEGEDGWLHEFSVEETEETFDGFDTFSPAGLKIVVK